jgi:hypothetical protein
MPGAGLWLDRELRNPQQKTVDVAVQVDKVNDAVAVYVARKELGRALLRGRVPEQQPVDEDVEVA